MTRAEVIAKAHGKLRAAGAAALSVIRRAVQLFDARDVHFYGGLLLAGVGGFHLSRAWTLIAVGAVLMLVGLRRAPNPPRPR